MRWYLAGLGLLLVVVLPFIFFGEAIEAYTVQSLNAESGNGWMSLGIVVALAMDVLLPVPSAMVGTLAGAVFTPIAGALLIWVGMTFGCWLAFLIGQNVGGPLLDRFVGAKARAETGRYVARRDAFWLILFRPVPVLAEASVLSAGALSLPFRRFMSITSIANIPIAIIYAFIGHWAVERDVFWPAFGAVAVTLVLFIVFSGLAKLVRG